MALGAYADTSLLVSLYVQDANSAKAAGRAAGLFPLPLPPLLEHELRNAIRLCVFRGQITSGQRERAIHDLESDKSAGILHEVPVEWPAVFRHAENLGRKQTESLGARGMDILHVACALSLKTKRFATFDERQRRLAVLAGLTVT